MRLADFFYARHPRRPKRPRASRPARRPPLLESLEGRLLLNGGPAGVLIGTTLEISLTNGDGRVVTATDEADLGRDFSADADYAIGRVDRHLSLARPLRRPTRRQAGDPHQGPAHRRDGDRRPGAGTRDLAE